MFAYEKPEQKKTFKNTVQKKEAEKPAAKPNLTGIPDIMKSRFENLSGFSFDDVRVHYNSDKPDKLQALAYTQGNQVYVGPGQEKHLGHELGHVVQQKQDRVQPTAQLQGANINDNEELEKEADIIGEHHINFNPQSYTQTLLKPRFKKTMPIQMITDEQFSSFIVEKIFTHEKEDLRAVNAAVDLSEDNISLIDTLREDISVEGMIQIGQSPDRLLSDRVELANRAEGLSAEQVCQLAGIHAGIDVNGMVHIGENIPATKTVQEIVTFANKLKLLTAQQVILLLSTHADVSIDNILKTAIKHKVAEIDNFSGRSNVRIGVGESMNLNIEINPPGIPVASIGGLKWTASIGKLTLAGDTGVGLYRALYPGALLLQLVVVDGGYKDEIIADVNKDIVAPDGSSFIIPLNPKRLDYITRPVYNISIGVLFPGQRLMVGTDIWDVISLYAVPNVWLVKRERPDVIQLPEASFDGRIYLAPKDVSFSGVKFNEGTAQSSATGSFAKFDNWYHPVGPLLDVRVPINSSAGSLAANDDVKSGPADNDEAGSFIWNIPWYYRVDGGVGETMFMIAVHNAKNESKKVSIMKAGSGWQPD